MSGAAACAQAAVLPSHSSCAHAQPAPGPYMAQCRMRVCNRQPIITMDAPVLESASAYIAAFCLHYEATAI